MKTNSEKNGKADNQPTTNGHRSACEKIIETLQLNNGRLPLWELEELSHVKRGAIEDLLEESRRTSPIRLEYVNGNGKSPTAMVILKDFEPQEPVSPNDLAKRLNSMSPGEYRDFLCGVDSTFKARLQRRGYRRRGISAEEYLEQF